MKHLPLPVRLAAGLAVTALEQARHLPEKLAELPVTMVSQALQMSMRLQQQVTELAIKGDDALATLRPAEESPAWATFDEDESPATDSVRSRFDDVTDDAEAEAEVEVEVDTADETAADPWAREEQALRSELSDADLPSSADELMLEPADDPATSEREQDEPESAATAAVAPAVTPAVTPAEATAPTAPTALPRYPDLSLPQLRARLRTLTVDSLTELLEYERAHANRPDFAGMLARRIATVRENSARDNGAPSNTERNSAKLDDTTRNSR